MGVVLPTWFAFWNRYHQFSSPEILKRENIGQVLPGKFAHDKADVIIGSDIIYGWFCPCKVVIVSSSSQGTPCQRTPCQDLDSQRTPCQSCQNPKPIFSLLFCNALPRARRRRKFCEFGIHDHDFPQKKQRKSLKFQSLCWPKPRANEPRAKILFPNEPRAGTTGTGFNPETRKLCCPACLSGIIDGNRFDFTEIDFRFGKLFEPHEKPTF